MLEKLTKNNTIFAVIFLTFIFLLGIRADYNLYRFKVFGEANSNYELGSAVEGMQTEYAANFPLKVNMVDLNGLIRRLTGIREMNGVIKLNNGYLTKVSDIVSDDQLNTNVEAIVQYVNYCNERGIRVIYVQGPYNISKYDPQLPAGVTDGHNESLDMMLDRLREKGVETIDLRELMYEDGIDQYDMFYVTDHHYTTEGAFYAYRKIAEQIAADTGTTVDPKLLDINNYQTDVYPEWHLGSNGQRTGAYFAGIDDYHLIYPKFETNIYNSDDQSVSTLYEALVNTDVFSNRNLQNRYTYDLAYTNNDINSLKSLDAETDLNVLLLSDSFQQAIKSYMLLTYKEFHIEDYWNLSASVVNRYQPDVIVIMTWGGNVGTPSPNTMTFNDDQEA